MQLPETSAAASESEPRSNPQMRGRKRPAEENGQPFAYWLTYTDRMNRRRGRSSSKEG
jgi:hypothetical protein